MQNAKGLLVLLIALLAGGLLGASGTVFYYEHQVTAKLGQRPPHLHNPHEKAVRLARILGLNPAQQARAEAIITRHEPEVETLHAQAKATLDRVLTEVSRELAPSLDPDQNARLEKFLYDIKSRPFPPRPDHGGVDGPDRP